MNSKTYTFDYANRLSSTVIGSLTTTYQYNHEGQRVYKSNASGTIASPYTFYETDSGTTTKHIYTPSGDLLSTIDKKGSTTTRSYAHTDHLGSTVAITSNTGAVSQVLEYYPYGGTRIDQRYGATNQRNQYIGKTYDSESEMSYLGARYYDSKRGQFVSQDPTFWSLNQNLMNPQSFNSYSYAENNPINKKDPLGLSAQDAATQAKIRSLQRQIIGLLKQQIQQIADDFNRGGRNALLNPIQGAKTVTNSNKSNPERVGAAFGTAVNVGSLFVPYLGEARGGQLLTRARQISEVLDPIAQSRRTTAVLQTTSGEVIVAGGGRDLTRAQIQALMSGERAATAMPGAHAEVTALTEAATSQSTPQMIAASRPICASCQAFIESTGGTVVDAFTAVWK